MLKKAFIASFILSGVVLLAGCVTVTKTDENTNQAAELTTQEIVDLVGDSVVSIECYTSETEEYYFGSGVVWNEDGDIITNNHVIPQDDEYITADYCLVYFIDSETGVTNAAFYADPYVLNGTSEDYDLAMLEIGEGLPDENGYQYKEMVFPAISFETCPEEETAIELGEKVIILGYPDYTGGYNLTVSEGIVSSYTSDGLISTTAKVDSGNSGGLAVDQNGCMLGIPSAVNLGDYENMGIVIPSGLVMDFLDEVYVE